MKNITRDRDLDGYFIMSGENEAILKTRFKEKIIYDHKKFTEGYSFPNEVKF